MLIKKTIGVSVSLITRKVQSDETETSEKIMLNE